MDRPIFQGRAPYKYMIVRGPYYGKSKNRWFVKIYMAGHYLQGRTTSYARYLMEIHLGRLLDEGEIVHHEDGNQLNDSISNLEVMNYGMHTIMHKKRNYFSHSIITNCVCCYKQITLTGRQHAQHFREIHRSKTIGPYCSKSCALKIVKNPSLRKYSFYFKKLVSK